MTSLETIIDAAAEVYHLPSDWACSQSRVKPIAEARQVCMMLARELTPYSVLEIGQALHRDHSTVVQMAKKAKDREAKNQYYARRVAEVRGRVSWVAVPELGTIGEEGDPFAWAGRGLE